MQIVPVIATPNQIEAVPLDGQSYIVQVSQRSTGLYIDVFMNGEPIILGVLCENRNLIIRNVYLGATGDFYFVDTRGDDDPDYTGLGDRFLLMFAERSELEAAGVH
jgi:hypothetical protein